MFSPQRVFWLALTSLLAIGSIVLIASLTATAAAPPPPDRSAASDGSTSGYIVLSWNDLGMHCYNRDFNDLAVLPPANSLWAQVVKIGDPPQVITTGVTVEYFFADNTDSVSKSDFWSTNPYTPVQNAQKLFGLPAPLPANMGLAGKGLSGQMDLTGDHFEAKWIPLTEYSDSNPTVRDPYQLATVIARDANTHVELARSTVVAPVSTEMHCDNCHYNNGPGNEGISSPTVEQNILKKHDQDNMDDYPAGHRGALMNRRPVLCAECHASNALGAPGAGDVPSLSNAMHERHAGVMPLPQTIDTCYNCHPGPLTQCLRDVMSQLPAPNTQTCLTCHGDMQTVSQNPQPWLHEPRCDTCHNNGNFNQNQALYRMSQGHGSLFCESCHDSTHAIAPSTLPNKDGLKFFQLQGHNGPINTCTVCHTSTPTQPGPHGILPFVRSFSFGPARSGTPAPGATLIYTHTLINTGNLSDTYQLAWHSTQPTWSSVSAITPATLTSGQRSWVTVTVNIPNNSSVIGQQDITVITATSMVSPSLSVVLTDFTLVPRARIFLPVILR